VLGIFVAIVAVNLYNKNSDNETASSNELLEASDGTPTNEVEIIEVVQIELELGKFFEGGMIYSLAADSKSGIVVHLEDFGPMTWANAMKIDEQLGEGWRIPTLDELKALRNAVGQGAENQAEFSNGLYWSATEYDQYQARLLRFRDGNATYRYNKDAEHRKYRVRAIRDFTR
jgi:hypothetical protein